MKSICRNLFIILSLVVLASCQSTEKFKFQDQNFQISDVEVSVHNNPKKTHKLLKPTESFRGVLTNTIRNYAAEYNATRPNANVGYKLKVDITQVHYKNAIASLLVGDNNRIQGTASIIDPNTGSVLHTAPANYVDGASGLLNGISGAVLSIVVKKEAAEATMSKGVSKNIMKFIYPTTKLTKGAEARLKDKTVLQPRTSAISSLSAPEAVEDAALETSEPEVVTLN